MPFKDKAKRNEAIRKSQAKKPELYRELHLKSKRKQSRRGYNLQRLYGISMEFYNEMLHNQGDGCAICGGQMRPTASGRCGLYVDHCHETGRVRGILCSRCNTFVGYLDKPNSKVFLEKAKAYLGY